MSNEYQDVLAALERRASLAEIQPLLVSLKNSSTGINAGIDYVDAFGLTICMRAAAHGRLGVVKAARELGARIDRLNPFTGANLLHYAAQQPVGGAEIITWAILQEKASAELLSKPILVLGKDRDREEEKHWDRGNGHTVAFEAVFNNNVPVIKALLELEKQGHAVDFKTPAVHGSSPLGWALKYDQEQIVSLLRSSKHWHQVYGKNTSGAEIAKDQDSASKNFVDDHNKKWRDTHENDRHALDLAYKLRNYIIGNASQSVDALLQEVDAEFLNKPYGRFGQPLLILVPTDPVIMDNPTPPQDQKNRYAEVVSALLNKKANPRIKEKGLMEVSAGFREVFFGYMDALKDMIERVKDQSERENFVNEVGVFNGYTRLIDAGLIANTEAIELLLDYGIDQSIKGFNGRT